MTLPRPFLHAGHSYEVRATHERDAMEIGVYGRNKLVSTVGLLRDEVIFAAKTDRDIDLVNAAMSIAQSEFEAGRVDNIVIAIQALNEAPAQ
jgi:hypothetical protein